MELTIDYDHIIDDNYERFVTIGLTDRYMINALLENAVKKIVEKYNGIMEAYPKGSLFYVKLILYM